MKLVIPLTSGREAEVVLPTAPLDRSEAAELVREFLLLATVVSSFHDGADAPPYRAMRSAVDAYVRVLPDEALRAEVETHGQHLGEKNR